MLENRSFISTQILDIIWHAMPVSKPISPTKNLDELFKIHKLLVMMANERWCHFQIIYIYPNFQSLHIVQLTYIKVEGIKTNIYNRLPIANTLLSYIVPHDVGVSRPTEWRFRCQSYSVSICLLKFVMPIFERLNHFKAIQEDHNKFMIWNYLESWDSLQHQLQCINQKNKECLGIEIYVVIEYLHN